MDFINMSAKDCFYRVIHADLYCKKMAIISIQDEMCTGFRFQKSKYCMDVLTLDFDDADEQFGSVKLYTKEQARQVFSFVKSNLAVVEEFIIHCAAGISRSAGMAAALSKIYNKDDTEFFKASRPNMFVYRQTLKAWEELSNPGKLVRRNSHSSSDFWQ